MIQSLLTGGNLQGARAACGGTYRGVVGDRLYRVAGVFRTRGARGSRDSIMGVLDAPVLLASTVLGVTVMITGVEFVVDPDRTDSGGEEIVPLSK